MADERDHEEPPMAAPGVRGRRAVAALGLAAAAVLVGAQLANPGSARVLGQAVGATPSAVARTESGAAAATLDPVLDPTMDPTAGPTLNPTPPPQVALGAFIPGASSDPAKIDAYARLVGRMPAVVMWYQRWEAPWNDFDPRTPNAILARGAMPMISWEPQNVATTDAAWSLASIVDGAHDAYIRRWTAAVAAWGRPIYVRPMFEMNGWWAPWGVEVNGNSASAYVAAWRHIVDIARSEGATNIRWVWCPNVDNDGLGVPFASLYPGDAYVDWVGLDGFNRGTSWSSTSWVTLERIFTVSIRHLREVSGKPLLIGETGSSEVGGDKAAWIESSFARIPEDLPGVRAVIWFDKLETEVGIDWRVNSSAASLAAFRSVATSPVFSGTLP